jgi:hypothetical protein
MLRLAEGLLLVATGLAIFAIAVAGPTVLLIRDRYRPKRQYRYSARAIRDWEAQTMVLTVICVAMIVGGYHLLSSEVIAAESGPREWQPTPTVHISDMFR